MTDQRGMQRTGSPSRAWLHPAAWAVALVPLGLGLGFDVLSQRSGRQYVNAHRAWVLYGWGTLVVAIAVVAFIAHLVSIEGDADARRRAIQHLIPLDVTLLWFGFTYLSRRSSSLVPTSQWKIAVTGLVGLVSLVGLVLEVRRVRAALDAADESEELPADWPADPAADRLPPSS